MLVFDFRFRGNNPSKYLKLASCSESFIFNNYLVLVCEYCKKVAYMVLIKNNNELVMTELIFNQICGVCDVIVAFTKSIATGTVLICSKSNIIRYLSKYST